MLNKSWRLVNIER